MAEERAGTVTISRALFNFLMGVGDIDGVSFGENPLPSMPKGKFWWRKLLRRADEQAKPKSGPGIFISRSDALAIIDLATEGRGDDIAQVMRRVIEDRKAEVVDNITGSDQSARIAELEAALEIMVEHYVELVKCGDCGFWDPEAEDEVKAARTALQKEDRNDD